MSSQQESSNISLIAGEALEVFRRVKINSSGQVVYAGVGEEAHGVTQAAAESGYSATIKLINGTGTFRIACSAAVVRGALLYGTASGKVDDAGTGAPQYIALEAGSGDGANIQCARVDGAANEFVGQVTVSAGQAAAGGGNGQVDFVHNWGANPAFTMPQVRSSAGAPENTWAVTFPDTNTIRITGAGAGNIAANDVVSVIARRTIS
jgi:hypothetical protein